MTQNFDPGEQPLPGSPGAVLPVSHYTNTLNVLPQDKPALAGNYQDSELTLYDLSGGLNKVWGRMFPRYLGVETGDSNRTSSANGTDPTYPGQLILSNSMSSETIWAQNAPFCWTMFNNLMVLGANATTANLSLYQEQGNGSATLSAITYTPANKICSLTRVYVAGVERLIVGMEGTAADVLSTAYASAATMDAATSSLWGMIRTQAGSGTDLYLIYSGTGSSATIKTLAASAAITTAPTASLTGLNGGGYGVGVANVAITPGNLVSRAVWVIPQIGLSTSMMNGAAGFGTSPVFGYILHTTVDGLDPQKLITRLPYVIWCVVNEGVLFYTDGFRLMMNNGVEHDLGWLSEREPNSDIRYFATGLGVANGSLVVQNCALNKQTVGSSTIQYERMDNRTKTFQPLGTSTGLVNNTTSTSDAGPELLAQKVSAYPMGPLAFSQNSFNLHHLPMSLSAAKDWRMFVAPDGYSPFWNYRGRTPGSSQAGQGTEASGTWDSPALLLPHPLTGYPTVITDITIMGDVAAGGLGGTTLASIQWQQATQGVDATYSYSSNISHKATSADSQRWQARHKSFGMDQWDSFTRLKLRCTLTRYNTNTDTTPNGLPVRIRMRTFMDGVVKG